MNNEQSVTVVILRGHDVFGINNRRYNFSDFVTCEIVLN